MNAACRIGLHHWTRIPPAVFEAARKYKLPVNRYHGQSVEEAYCARCGKSRKAVSS